MISNTLFAFFQRFTQYLASNNCKFNLSGFLDKAGVAGEWKHGLRLTDHLNPFTSRTHTWSDTHGNFKKAKLYLEVYLVESGFPAVSKITI